MQQEVTSESVLGTIIGHLNVEKAKLIADRERLAREVQQLTGNNTALRAENGKLKDENAVLKAATAKKFVEPQAVAAE